MIINESAENYIETIYILSRNGSPIRSIDIATALEYTKPSVSVAMKNLLNSGHIEIDREGHITLTTKGMQIAEGIYEKHTLISQWLICLGVDKKIAVEDACRIEHVLSEESFDALKNHIKSFNKTK